MNKFIILTILLLTTLKSMAIGYEEHITEEPARKIENMSLTYQQLRAINTSKMRIPEFVYHTCSMVILYPNYGLPNSQKILTNTTRIIIWKYEFQKNCFGKLEILIKVIDKISNLCNQLKLLGKDPKKLFATA